MEGEILAQSAMRSAVLSGLAKDEKDLFHLANKILDWQVSNSNPLDFLELRGRYKALTDAIYKSSIPDGYADALEYYTALAEQNERTFDQRENKNAYSVTDAKNNVKKITG